MANATGSVFDPAAAVKAVSATTRIPLSNTGTDGVGYNTASALATYVGTALSLGTMATQNANAVAITGGTMQGVTIGTTLTPTSNDGAALGTGALSWSDLFLASGGVINFNNGNLTLTHSAGVLTLAGAQTVTSNSATAFVVGPNGTTNPAFVVAANTASMDNGITITGGTAGATIAVTGNDTNATLSISSKGAAAVTIAAPGGAGASINLNPQNTTRYTATGSEHTFSNGTVATAANVRFGYTGASDTSLTAGTEAPGVYFNLGQTRQHASNTTIANQRDFRIAPSTHTFATAGGTITLASGLSVDGPPSGGANSTITTANGIEVATKALTNVTNGYGINVAAPSGATNNYAGNFSGAVNITGSTTKTTATASIDAAAILGQDVVTWTPASDPSGTFVTNRMRKTIVDVGTSSITGVDHPIGGYDYLVMQGNTNTLDLAFVHEAKFGKTGTGTLNNLSFYKPAIDTIAGTVVNITLYDGDMDLSGVTYTNAYLMNNANRSYLTFNTIGKIIGATGNEVPTSVWPTIASTRAYFSRGWGSTSTNAYTQGVLVACPPIVIPARTTFTKIGINVTSAIASSVARLGIYKMGASGIPTTLVLDAGTVSTASTGEREITISQSLEAGAYFLVYQNTGGVGAPTISVLAFAGSYMTEIYGATSGDPSTGYIDTLYVINSGTLPLTFGTPTKALVGAVPAVYLKV